MTDEVELVYRLRASDYVVATIRIAARRVLAVSLVLGALAGVVLGPLVLASPASAVWLGVVWAGMALGLPVVLTVLVAFNAWRLTKRRRDAFPVGDVHLAASPTGFVYDAGDMHLDLRWTFLHDARIMWGYLMLRTAPHNGIPVPLSAFGGRDRARDFAERVNTWARDARVGGEQGGAQPLAPLPQGAGYDLHYRNTVDDYIALSRHIIKGTRIGWFVLLLSLGLVCVAVLAAGLSMLTGSSLWEGLSMLLLASILAVVGTVPMAARLLVPWRVRRRVRREPHRFPLDERRLQVTPASVAAESSRGMSRFTWRQIYSVVEDGPRFFVFLGPHQAWIVPHDAFDDPRDCGRFLSQVQAWRDAAHDTGAPAAPRPDARADALADPFAPPGR